MDSNMAIVALQIVGNYCKRSPLLPIFIKRGTNTDYIYNLKASKQTKNTDIAQSQRSQNRKRERGSNLRKIFLLRRKHKDVKFNFEIWPRKFGLFGTLG
jgi:hypothetical protein